MLELKTYIQFYKKLSLLVKISLSLLLFSFLSISAKANNPEIPPPDTSKSGLRYPLEGQYDYPPLGTYSISPLLLPPPNIEQTVVYDPVTNSYVINEKIGNIDYRRPSMMSFQEYSEYQARLKQTQYWQERAKEESGGGPSFLGGLRLGNQSIDKVFGGEGIQITPQGSAELRFGYSFTNNENPSIPVRNQKNGSFIFKEKIMMNVTGSIGDKMEIGLNYNTEATFDFENKTKLEYSGKEDEIIKKIEAGDVSFSLPGSLITGSQSLFGLKTELQFGRLRVSTILSHQKGESSSINVQGGAQETEFEIDIDKYDVNRHFFLSQFFRDNYDKWMENLPYIESQLQIDEIEVWVVNKQNNFEESRDIVALTDIGEGYNPFGEPNIQAVGGTSINDMNHNQPASNDLNTLYSKLAQKTTTRDLSTVNAAFASVSQTEQLYTYSIGRDYEYLENARRLTSREFTINKELGYVSLNSPMRNDEILAVAFTYTYKGKKYFVGELSTHVDAPNAIIVKLLKGTTQTPKYKNWDLMMKNIYSIGAYQVSKEGFVLDVLYRNDKTGVATNYLTEDEKYLHSGIWEQTYLTLLRLDNLDSRNEPITEGDGLFDYIEGITINSRNGRIIFPVIEPFGEHLYDTLANGTDKLPEDRQSIAKKYVFNELYDSTQTKAQQLAEKNKFVLKGRYRSTSSSDIMLNAMNIPRGSVIVMAGGRELTENVDYTVDYTLGRVKIINPGLAESGTPIQVKLESNSLFNLQTKTLLGTHLDYQFSENFNVGGTILRLTERPLTQKVNIGDEPISNTIWGLNTSYRTESQLLTSMIDKLPFLETKELSSIALDAEFAQLIPGQSKMISTNGENGIAYIDDFEGAQTKIELKTLQAWTLCSPPNDTKTNTFDGSEAEGLASGFNRAKLAWYLIDPIFYGNYGPGGVDNTSHEVRQIYQKEIFPNKDDDIPGFQSRISVLNLAYYPNERGPYNFDSIVNTTNNTIPNPRENWAGIMREIVMSDFETANIEFIEFWIMDPFVEREGHDGGKLYFHLGEISEDILKDNEKSFENGLPTSVEVTNVDTTVWGRIPSGNDLSFGFAGGAEERSFQDIGLDGLNDADEKDFFSKRVHAKFFDFDDPSGDNFEYYLGDRHDGSADDNITRRYKNYNGFENNSPAAGENNEYSEANRITPDIEDINDDNTLNKNETYYQYEVDISTGGLSTVGSNYIVDKIEGETNGDGEPVTWYQFRIPLDDYQYRIGDIEDFKSIRFMRLMLTDFNDLIVLRFGTLDLIRGEWRRYKQDVYQSSPTISESYDNTSFEVSSVNIEENGNKSPVNYVLPPDITRVTDPNQPQVKQLNEQSLLIKVNNLEDSDARAVFKTTQLDLRQYQKLKMFIHAEALPDAGIGDIEDYELTAFIRIGSDYQNNYYELEVPLKLTEPQANKFNNDLESDREIVWPNDNRIELNLQDLVALKVERDKAVEDDNTGFINYQTIYEKNIKKYDRDEVGNIPNKIKVKGRPNLSNIRQIMLGIRNPGDEATLLVNDGDAKSAEVWFNELRLTDFNNEGGWAANGQFQAKLADLGILSVAGATSKPGFGSIEQTTEQRQKEEINQIDVTSNLELGKFFPEKAQVTVPLFVGYSNTTINPEYYPKDPDIKLKDALARAEDEASRKKIKEESRDLTERKSINLTNVRWNKQFKKMKFLSPANLSATATYSLTEMRDYSTEYNKMRKYGASLNYVFNNRPKPVTPFSKMKAVRKPAFRIIRDFNFNYQPSAFTFSTKFDRDYQSMKLRNVYDDVDLLIKPTTSKGLYWDRNYSLRWDFTRTLKFNYKATNRAIIDEPNDSIYRASDWFEPNNQHWKDSVWTNIRNGGRNLQFNQNMGLEYTLPLNKIPILNWTNIRASYNATMNWTRGPRLYDNFNNTPGHTLKNSNSIRLNGNFNLKNLYNKVPYFKELDAKARGRGKKEEEKRYKTVEYSRRTFVNKDKPKSIIHRLGTEDVTITVLDEEGKEIDLPFTVVSENKITIESEEDLTGITVTVIGKIEKGENPFVFITENSVRLLLGFKNINATYNITSSTMLPGFMPETNLFGVNLEDFYGAPGLPFVAGWQDTDFGHQAYENGWLTQYEFFNQPNIYAENETFNFRTTYEPFKGLRIDITGTRNHSRTSEENYYPYLDSIGPLYQGGTFSMSVITIGTAFEEVSPENNWSSSAYERLKNVRQEMSRRLIGEKSSNENYERSQAKYIEPGYSDGYGSTSAEVLMYSFLAAYTNKDADKVDLNPFPWTIAPNWKVTFDGLSKLKFFQKFLKNITLTHSYKSTYNMNGYATNVNFYETPTNVEGLGRDNQRNFVAMYQPNSVSINEQLSPLVAFDMTWHNSLLTKFEIARTRMVSLSLNNNQITETRNKDFVFGAGYKFKDVQLPIKTASGGQQVLKSDLNVRFDLTIRDNITLIRSLVDEADDTPTTGARKVAVDLTADYVLSQRVNIQFYIRRDVNDPYVSNYYRNSETEFGFSLRMSL